MPRFFFNTNDDLELWDDEGTDLPDLDAARRAAVRYVGEILREGPGIGLGETWQLKASDTSDTVLFTIDVKVTPTQAMLSVPGLERTHRQPRKDARQLETFAHQN